MKIVLILILLLQISNICSAAGTMMYPANGEITSPYGFRIHPVHGVGKKHTGIDIGADFGEPVVASADGTVVSADWAGGYGNLVIIDHGNGLTTFYGHNNSIVVREGDSVKQGTLIARCGSTGYSTGPHVHFEVREYDVPVDPAGYLDGSRTIPVFPEYTITADGITFKNSDFNEMNIQFDSYFDFAKPLRDAINTFSKQCTIGIKLVQEYVKWLFFALIVIDLAVSAMFSLFDEGWEPINWLFKKFLKYGFVLFLIVHWGDLICNASRDYFVFMGATAAGTDIAGAGKVLSDPTFIVQKGAYIVGPAFMYIMNFAGSKIMFGANLMNAVMALVLAFAILFCYLIVGYQIMMAYLEFYIIASLSVVTLGFGGLKHTKFVAEKGLGALIAVSLKLMIFSFLAVFMSETVKDYGNIAYEMFNYLKILLASMLFVFLGSRVCGTAGKLLNGGSPKL